MQHSELEEGMMDDERLLEQFTSEFGKLYTSQEKLTLEMTPLEAWAVFSNLQLALRHPSNNSKAAKMVKKIARKLQAMVAPDGALAEVAQRGWDAAYGQ